MSAQIWIWIALTISVVAFLACVWQFANLQGYKARGRRRSGADRSSTRRSDKRKLTGAEKRLYAQAQQLIKDGKIAPAARIFEQLKMPREAIQTLEDHDMIHEAAKILMRMQRHNRAGVVYARHGMWEDAAQCFRMAGMPLEVAKCAREANNYPMAAEYFEKVGRTEDAADCFERTGDLQKAARLFTSTGHRQKAMNLYGKLAEGSENLARLELEDAEIQQIVDYLGEGHTVNPALADVAVSRNKLTDVVLNLVRRGLVRQSSELLLRSTTDIGPQLMAEIGENIEATEVLADVFIQVSQFHYAGMLFERMKEFPRAAEAFEKAEDFDRASYCYERSGNEAKARTLKEKAQNQPDSPTRGPAGSPFALADLGDTGAKEAGAEEATMAVAAPSPAEPVSDEASEPAPAEPAESAESHQVPPPPAGRNAPETADAAASSGEAKASGNFALEEDEERDEETDSPLESPIESPAHPIDSAETHSEENALSEPPPPPQMAAPSLERAADEPAASEETPLPPVSDQMPDEPVELDEGRAVFHKAKFLGDLDFAQKNKIWNIGVTYHYDQDQAVLTYNDEPEGVYIIIQGSVSCYRTVGGREQYVDQMGASESFGELWLLADQPTAVRFVAAQNTRIRVIRRDPFNDLLDKDGTIARKLYKKFTMRLLRRLLKPENPGQNKEAS